MAYRMEMDYEVARARIELIRHGFAGSDRNARHGFASSDRNALLASGVQRSERFGAMRLPRIAEGL